MASTAPPTPSRALRRIVVIAGTALAVAAIAITAAIALGLAYQSSQRSVDTAECVNRVQGQRAAAANLVTEAQLNDTRAELAYERGQIGKTELLRRKDAYRDAQIDAERYRQQHPAGRC